MEHYRLKGIHRDTGNEKTLTLVAENRNDAVKQASDMGYIVDAHDENTTMVPLAYMKVLSKRRITQITISACNVVGILCAIYCIGTIFTVLTNSHESFGIVAGIGAIVVPLFGAALMFFATSALNILNDVGIAVYEMKNGKGK